MANNEQLYVEFTIPINEWAGSGTVNVAGPNCEWAYNTGNVTAAGGSDTTSFGYGPSGTPVLSYNSSTVSSSTSFTVQWQYPQQQGDFLSLQFDRGTSGAQWATVGQDDSIVTFQQQNTSAYGAAFEIQSATQAKVFFGNFGRVPTGATFAASGSTWSGIAGAGGWRWRMQKCSASPTPGFQTAAANVGSSGLVSYEDSGSFSASFTGAASTTVTVLYNRVGKAVTLTLPSNAGLTCSAATSFTSSSVVPSALRPITNANSFSIFVRDGSADQNTPGIFSVGTGGTLTIGKTNASSSFTGSGGCGWYSTAVTYAVQ